MAITPGIDNIYVQAYLKFVFQLAPLTNMTQIYVIGRSFIILRTPQTQWYFLRKFGKAHPCDRQLSHLIDSNLRSSTISVRFGFFFFHRKSGHALSISCAWGKQWMCVRIVTGIYKLILYLSFSLSLPPQEGKKRRKCSLPITKPNWLCGKISYKDTSIFIISSLAVGAETTICRAPGLMNPSSTPLSNNASKLL